MGSSSRALRLQVKRTFDVALAGVLLVGFSPVLLIVAVAIRVTMGRPVLFRQVRPGRDKRPFTILKFRTMVDAPAGGDVPRDAVRLTSLGRVLRTASLDELPQLVNILKGEMSFVGPRPLLMRYLPYFAPSEALRFEMWPGVTGWAQVQGRNALSWDERLGMDAWYVEHWSLRLDIEILVRTVGTVVSRRGLAVDTGASMRDLDDERRESFPGRESGV